MIPYTYYLYHKPTGLKYYGCQYGKKSNPNDLWKTYFSSSKKVHKLIKEYGKESFEYEVRKLFATKEECVSWEEKFLRKIKAIKNKEWLNENIGGKNFSFINNRKIDELTKLKISKSKLGHSVSNETRTKISNSKLGTIPWNKGIAHSEITKKKISQNKIINFYKIVEPNQQVIITSNLKIYCINNRLDYRTMQRVLSGKYKHHKQYRVEYYNE